MDEKVNQHELLLENESLRKELHGLSQSKGELQKINIIFTQLEQFGDLGYWEWDAIAGRYITCSKHYANLNNMTVEQMMAVVTSNEEGRECISEDDRERYIQVVDSAVESKQGWDIEYCRIDKAGKRVYLHEIGQPVLDDYGVIIKTVGTVQNVTQIRRVRDELQQSRALFGQAEVMGNMGHWSWDLVEGKLASCSDQFARIYGMTVPEALDYFISNDAELDLVHPDDKENFSRAVYGPNRLHNRTDLEYRIITSSGDTRHLYASSDLSLDNDSACLQSFGTVQDITKRKLAEEQLRKSNVLFSQSEAMGSMGHFHWDFVEDKLIFCSDQYAKLFGMTVPEALDYFISTDAELDLVHPDDKALFKQESKSSKRLNTSMDFEYRIITSSGDTRHVYAKSERVFDNDGILFGAFGTLQDITERKSNEDKLKYEGTHDALTGLINRSEFERRTNCLLSSIQKDRTEHALCFLDLDQFKIINDTCGHIAGDDLLRQLGGILQSVVGDSATLARLGGDEFGLLIENSTIDQSQGLAELILIATREFQFLWDKQVFRIGLSIGLVAITDGFQEITKLLQQADAACYMAKELGRDQIHVYHPGNAEMALRKSEVQWVAQINQAFDDERFCLYAQPIKGISGNHEMHYEVLLRLLNEKGEIIPPGSFLPAAERYNLIEKLDRWVVNNTFELMAGNSEFFNNIHFISINLSGKSVTNPKFLEYILSELNRTKIKSGQICFEVTETVAISNLDSASTFLSILKTIGFSFALDDFGSGLSSFGYLKTLPVDYLKIDGMFVKDIINDPIDRAMVESINNIGHIMGMKTIAEFVENDEIRAVLDDIGVDYVQGYGIGKPEPFNEVISQFDRFKTI
jgi:diguanylate cyclase (GGDEF)-like protein/PAS domain S-box-containing protein